jgi:hypothetical protein
VVRISCPKHHQKKYTGGILLLMTYTNASWIRCTEDLRYTQDPSSIEVLRMKVFWMQYLPDCCRNIFTVFFTSKNVIKTLSA